jgi:hypothetical protein
LRATPPHDLGRGFCEGRAAPRSDRSEEFARRGPDDEEGDRAAPGRAVERPAGRVGRSEDPRRTPSFAGPRRACELAPPPVVLDAGGREAPRPDGRAEAPPRCAPDEPVDLDRAPDASDRRGEGAAGRRASAPAALEGAPRAPEVPLSAEPDLGAERATRPAYPVFGDGRPLVALEDVREAPPARPGAPPLEVRLVPDDELERCAEVDPFDTEPDRAPFDGGFPPLARPRFCGAGISMILRVAVDATGCADATRPSVQVVHTA